MLFHKVASMKKAMALMFGAIGLLPGLAALIGYMAWLNPLVAAQSAETAGTALWVLVATIPAGAVIGAFGGWRLAMAIDDPLQHWAQFHETLLAQKEGGNDVIPYVDFGGALGKFARRAQGTRQWLTDRAAEAARRKEETERAEAARDAHEASLAQKDSEQTTVVHALAKGLAKAADGDLKYRITEQFPQSYQQLKDDFNDAMEKLQDAMKRLALSAMGIRASTDEISQSAEDLSRRTENQAASLEETAAALDQITATVRKTAEGATEASQVVLGAKTEAQESGQVVRDAVAAMSEIERSAQQISQIIGVIDEIAFQTNLLALNAGVEAARAGDAGKGFAVVASEVRALAQRSAGAAKEIKALILTSTNQVTSGVQLVGQTGQALSRILAKVAEINQLVADIAASAKDQAAGLHEVNSSINQMDHVTQQNAAMVQESTAACFALASAAQQLTELIRRFEIGDVGEAKTARSAHRPAPRMARAGAVPAMKTLGSGGAARKIEVSEDGWEEF
jgi:methyl-accepting chemotaxis protein